MTTVYSRPDRGPRGRAGAAALLLLAAAGCSSAPPSRPNALVVVMSGVRADHTGAGGSARATTPAMDAVAASGAWFDGAVTVAASPISAQATILTGLYPSEHNATPDYPVLTPAAETIAETLKGSGYATAAFITDEALARQNGFAQGFDTFEEIRPEESGLADGGAAAAEDRFKAWLEARGSAAAAPFFAYVTLVTPRLPFDPPPEFQNKFMDIVVPIQRLEKLVQLWIPFARQFTLGLAGLTDDERAVLTSLYDAEIAYTDYRVGRMLEMLRQRKLLDSTLVVITSDTGEDLGQHGLLADTLNLYDSIVRVPLAVSLPGRIRKGERIAAQVQPTDLRKLILAVTAAPAEGSAPEEVSAAALTGEREVAMAEARVDPAAMRTFQEVAPPGTDLTFLQRNLLMARTPQFKYIITSRDSAALFDLKADPGETASVIATKSDVMVDLAGKLQAWAGSLQPLAPPPQAAAPAGAPASAQPDQPGSAAPGKRSP